MSLTEPPPPAPVVLQDSSDRLLPILDALPVPIMVHRFEAQAPVLLLNRRFSEVFGYGVEDAPTVATLTELAFPDPVCRAPVMAALLGAPETGSSHAGTAPEARPSMRDKSGTLHHVRFHVVRDGDLAIVTIEQQPATGTILPDPPHPSTANALQTAYALTENMPGGAYTMVLKPGEQLAHFAFVSRQFLEMLELTRAEAVGDPSKGFSRVHPDDRPRWLALNIEAFNKRAPFSGEARIIANGQTRWIVSEILPPLALGVPSRAIGKHAVRIFHDGGAEWRMVETVAQFGIR